MRVLLSTIGTRGDVQPLVALALELKALGQEARMCVPPDFRGWIEGLAIPVVPVGPELRPAMPACPPVEQPPPTWEQLRAAIEAMIANQFATIPAAARGCDIILGFGSGQVAARSVAEQMGIRYVYGTYCPATLPSPHHAPPPLWAPAAAPKTADNRTLWADDARCWNDMAGGALNSHRASSGLAPVADVRSHVFTGQPWLAADPTLGPWPGPAGLDVAQTGAWIASDRRPLAPDLVTFLETGEPPVYFGFGSTPAAPDLGKVMIKAARGLGRRAIVSRGWAGLSLPDEQPDCLCIGEVNQQALFRRVAAVVHHGGAGTTTAASQAGAPQVVIPQVYDQYYWAQRIHHLGLGTAHPPGRPAVGSLTTALSHALQPGAVARAQVIASAVRTDGARVAAQRLIACAHREVFP
ncbi:MAG: glycosyltransferase [Streptosporangiaceae bacterium]